MADLEEIYRRHIGAAMKAAWLATQDRDVAADLVQEAFVRCASRAAGIRDIERFGRYWQQAVVRIAANQGRDAGYERRLLDRLGRTRVTSQPLADGAVDRLALSATLDRLPMRQRAVLVARFYLDLSELDTAEALGMRVGTVKSTTSRALAALREVMTLETDR